jgi:putative transposase
MPRPPRIEVAGATYHVATRTTDGAPMFLDNPDRHRFSWTLAETVERYEWECIGFCQMTTHYHMLVVLSLPNLAAGMQYLNGRYAQRFNDIHGRSGHLFGGRYLATMVETDAHLLEVFRYVLLNPVRAGACARPEAWAWSSCRAELGLALRPSFLSPDGLLRHFGDELSVARARLRTFLDAGVGP